MVLRSTDSRTRHRRFFSRTYPWSRRLLPPPSSPRPSTRSRSLLRRLSRLAIASTGHRGSESWDRQFLARAPARGLSLRDSRGSVRHHRGAQPSIRRSNLRPLMIAPSHDRSSMRDGSWTFRVTTTSSSGVIGMCRLQKQDFSNRKMVSQWSAFPWQSRVL